MNFVLAGAVLVLLLLAGVFLYFSRGDGDGGETVVNEPAADRLTAKARVAAQRRRRTPVGEIMKGEVPDLAGVRVDDAIDCARAGRPQLRRRRDRDGEGTPGVVASQDPAPGTEGGSDTPSRSSYPRRR